jgi:hypothetical protein
VGYPPGTLPDFASPAGFGDEFLTRHLEQRHLLQAGFVDREIGALVRRLKKTGQWKRVLLVVTADHGISFEVGSRDRREATPSNAHEIAPVPLFIKRPGQTRATISPAYASTIDVLPTIARLLRTRPYRGVDGRSAFGPEVAARPGVAIDNRDLSATIAVPAAEIEARRHADRVGRARLFGTGAWSRVFRIGPNRQLLGTIVQPVPAAGRGRARFAIPHALRRVRPRAAVVPTLAAGSIIKGSSRGGRDLALAVNGRVAAVGRSFHLAGDRAEWFSLDFPESRLRKGSNSMTLYEVTGGGQLALLGSP